MLVQGKQRVEDRLGDLNKPLSNQNLLTWKDTPLYDAPSVSSAPFGTLANNLRYPILSKLKDLAQSDLVSDPHWRLSWRGSVVWTRRRITVFPC